MPADDRIDALEKRLSMLEDCEAARNLFQIYAAVLDTPDPASVTALFAPDAELRTPSRTMVGHDAIQEYFGRAFMADPSVKRHFIVNPRTEWLSPGKVRIESYFFFVGRRPDASVIGWGTYDDVIDVSGLEPRFLTKSMTTHLATDLEAGWATKLEGEPG